MGADKVIHRGALAINLLVIQKKPGDEVPLGLVISSLRPTNLTNFMQAWNLSNLV